MTLKIGILGSTKGTDMQAITDAIERGELDAEIVCVISNEEDAFILERAREHGIEAIFIEYSGNRRILFDKAAAKEFDDRGAELILLIGFMRIVSPWFCKHYENRVMNIHPSLLPLFAGGMDTNVHEEVLNKGIKVTGCTLHFVTPQVDKGPIIMQKPVMVEDSDTPDTLKAKVQQAEQEIMVETIRKFGEGKIKVEGNRVKIAK
ncbi:MAG: phosphoribosylglycinamide formyltransferase [Candidatus Aenigmarchaeota archaeon]|nr:phosphoribosylglycinamide formyltransferase [Candidatus Aenigmarchaeota archaeon]